MREFRKSMLIVAISLTLTGGTAFAMTPTPQTTQQNEVVEAKPVEKPKSEVKVEKKPAEKPVEKDEITTAVKQPEPISQKAPEIVIAPTDNETVAWNFLIANGFTRNQTAGIMGNLQQEHNFNTSDVAGGLGIAQWISGRRANLMAKGDYLNINTQLNFLLEELNGAEYRAKAAIVAAQTVEAATYAFSGQFERCGTCRNEQRVMYAYDILGRH